MSQTKTDLANSALRHLGATGADITNINTDTTPAGRILRQFLDESRRSVLRQFTWNFAEVPYKSELTAIEGISDNGSGLIRVTVTGHGFADGARVGISGVNGTNEANGEWEIDLINANSFDLLDSEFINTYVDEGVVSLAPAHGYRHIHSFPDDYLRFVRLALQSKGISYEISSNGILTDETTL